MTRPDAQPAPDADVTARARDRSGRIVAILLAAAAGVLLARVVLLILKALPLPGPDFPDWIAQVVGTAKWWLPALVGVLFAFSESARRVVAGDSVSGSPPAQRRGEHVSPNGEEAR